MRRIFKATLRRVRQAKCAIIPWERIRARVGIRVNFPLRLQDNGTVKCGYVLPWVKCGNVGPFTNVMDAWIIVSLYSMANFWDRDQGPVKDEGRRIFAVSAPKDSCQPRVAPTNLQYGAKEAVAPMENKRRMFVLMVVRRLERVAHRNVVGPVAKASNRLQAGCRFKRVEWHRFHAKDEGFVVAMKVNFLSGGCVRIVLAGHLVVDHGVIPHPKRDANISAA